MKNHLIAAAIASSLLPGAAGTVSAQATGAGGHGKNTFVETYDINKDGKVTREEFFTVRAKSFHALDLNHDGKVEEAEYVGEFTARLDKEAPSQDQRERQLKQAHVRFGVLDTDKNAILASAEFEASGARMFDRLDTSSDGVVDAKDTSTEF